MAANWPTHRVRRVEQLARNRWRAKARKRAATNAGRAPRRDPKPPRESIAEDVWEYVHNGARRG